MNLNTDLNFNVYIYCCGKSGSSTLNYTFNKNGYKSLHCHSSSYYIRRRNEAKINQNIFNVIENSMLNNERVYIIDSYRTPIERKISSFFQNYNDSNKEISYIIELLDKNIYSLEKYVSINELFDYFKIPYFKSFDFEKKYNITYYKNITFIKLRFEDINEWGAILSSIFGKNITIYNDNISEYKHYSKIYKIIKDTYKIPDIMIDAIKNDNEFKIYNKPDSQIKYLEYWNTRTKITIYENIPNDFNVIEYKEVNKDLQSMTDLQAKYHYELYGFKENRKYKYENISTDFNATEYKELNKDLQFMTDLQAKYHYEYTGYKENRKYKYENIPTDFNASEYKELNKDLQFMTDLQAKLHYESNGCKENRKYKYENISTDFNATEYKELNKDLQFMTDLQAKLHYEYTGCKENRKYKYENIPTDFNASEYKELNKDLQSMTDLQAKLHYESNGCKENRKYKYENIPTDFNASEYKELNDDLQSMTDLQAKLHYESNGYKENRMYKKISIF